MIKKVINNSLVKNTGVYTITSIMNAAIPFFLLPILTRYLSPEEYGIVSMFSLLITFVSPFVGLSLNGAIARQYYDKENVNLSEYIGNCLLIMLLSSAIIGVIFCFFSQSISTITSFPIKMLWTVIIFSLSQFINNIILSLFQVQKKAMLYGLFKISLTFTDMIISLILIVGIGYAASGRIFAQLVSVFAFSLFAIIFLFKKKWIKFSINKVYISNALNFGIPLIPHALSGTIISMTDRLFITNMVGISETGIYTVGYQIGMVINLLATSFNNAYVPWLYERLKKNVKDTKIKIVKFTYLYFIVIILVALVFGTVAPFFLSVFIGKSFAESSSFVIWIALGYAFQGMYFMVVNYIFYEQKNSLLAGVTFLVAIINVLLNYFFIKSYGAIGAAQATTVVFFIKFILVWILSAKVHKMPWKDVLLNRN